MRNARNREAVKKEVVKRAVVQRAAVLRVAVQRRAERAADRTRKVEKAREVKGQRVDKLEESYQREVGQRTAEIAADQKIVEKEADQKTADCPKAEKDQRPVNF